MFFSRGSGWVGGWVDRKVEENGAGIRMGHRELGVWVGGWVGGWVGRWESGL